MKTTLKVFAAIFLIAYPFFIYLGFTHLSPLFTNFFIIFLLGLRLLLTKNKPNPINTVTRYVLILMVFLCLAGIFTQEFQLAKLYPVILNYSLFLLFCYSLKKGQTPIIESLARIKENYLPVKGIQYVRVITIVWACFFVMNGSFSLYTYLYFSLEAWTWYNGFVSYLLIALIFAIEYPFRLFFKRRWSDTYRVSIGQINQAAKKHFSLMLQSNTHYRRVAISFSEPEMFMAALVAALERGLEIIMLPNYQPSTIEEFKNEYDLLLSDSSEFDFTNIDNTIQSEADLKLAAKFTMFTSGSQGVPKKVEKNLDNLILECEALEKLFPAKAENEIILTSVSHHHIYGLLFRILWPLTRGAKIANFMIEYPEQLEKVLKEATGNYTFISSPAFLKRLNYKLQIQNLRTFSSGGSLSYEAAQNTSNFLGSFPIEIFGSTETGGIAWRTQGVENASWELLLGVRVEINKESCLRVYSPYILEGEFQSHDQVELINQNQFKLLGRIDRIAKIEEKRISLVELENRIKEHPFIADCHCIVLEMGERVIIGCLIVLNPQNDWKNSSKIDKVKQLKTYLLQYFEPILLPKKYRFVEELPYNAQSKLVRSTVMGYFDERSGN